MDDDTFEDDEPTLDDEFGPEADELDVELDVELDDELADDDVDLTDDLDVELVDVEDDTPREVPKVAEEEEEEDEDEDALDLEEELHPDDVEAPLDALLQERTASATLEDDDDDLEDDDEDPEDRGEVSTKIIPRRPGEFLCSSCFLVLPRTQLANEARMLCRDCA